MGWRSVEIGSVQIIILLSLSCSILFVLLTKSPFIIRLGLVIFSFILRLTLHRSGCMWVAYTLIIMFLGGIMIVFIYASSIDSVFKLIIKLHKVVVLSLLSATALFNINQFSPTPVWLNFCCSSLGVLCVMALLILSTLFIVVKLVQIREGPLKF